MAWLVIFLLILVGFVALLIWLRWNDTKFLRKSAKDTMDKGFKSEIDYETHDAVRRKKLFEESMKRRGF